MRTRDASPLRVTAWALAVVLLLAAWALAQSDDRTRVFDAPLDRIWTVTRSTLRSLGWDIEKEDRAAGWLRTDSRRTEGEDFGVYATGVKHRLRVLFTNLPDGRTQVTIERRVWREERFLWMDKGKDLSASDHRMERDILDAIGATL
jgi:hypothetical protein